MFNFRIDRRKLLTMTGIALLAACKAVPVGPPPSPPPPDLPSSTLPTDTQRHRVALLVPLSGPSASGQVAALTAFIAAHERLPDGEAVWRGRHLRARAAVLAALEDRKSVV